MADPSYHAEAREMQLLTADYVRQLTEIWKNIFDEEMCRENLAKLAQHAKEFYDELKTESETKRELIKIEITRLREEAQNLRRLLNVEVELPLQDSDQMPLLVLQSEMDNALHGLRLQLRERRAQICELLLQQESLCEELGVPPRALLDDPLPSADELEEFSAHLEVLREERVSRLQRLSSLRREIKTQLQTLELKAQTDAEQHLLQQRDVILSASTFETLERMRKYYGAQVAEMRELIDGMRRKLVVLWERLQVPHEERQRCERHNEYNQRTYDIFYQELQRCEKLRSENVKHFVQQIRDELKHWWEKTLKSKQQRARFSHYTSNCYTDDLLVLHEMELEDLKHYYETNRDIFTLYDARKILWERMCALEAKASEPNRYNNRGGQLLKEERERKTIATKLPKIEQQISELVGAYEQREHEPFFVNGENILELIAGEWARKREEKEKHSSARKQAATPASAAASHSRSQLGNGGRTPMLKNASSISNLRKTPSTSSLYGGGAVAGPSSAAATSSAHKRKLNPAERHATPVAKRSLMHALSSPSVVFLKPGAVGTPGSAFSAQKRRFRSPRVIATTIRRRSGRISNTGTNIKKRRSMNKSGSAVTKSGGLIPPKIVVQKCTSSSDEGGGGGGGDDTYESFEKCIEPASRSSILQSSLPDDNNARVKRMRKIVDDENERLAHLPKPQPHPPLQTRTPSRHRIPVRTPSKRTGGGGDNHHASSTVHSPGSSNSSSCRKLTTRNLPIII